MDESFLPYAMIRPLIRKGMTARQLGRKITNRLCLDPAIHGAVYVQPAATFAESLRGGIRIVKKTTEEFLTAPKFNPNEPAR